MRTRKGAMIFLITGAVFGGTFLSGNSEELRNMSMATSNGEIHAFFLAMFRALFTAEPMLILRGAIVGGTISIVSWWVIFKLILEKEQNFEEAVVVENDPKVRTRQLLRKIPFFGDLEEDELKQLVEWGHFRQVPTGQVVFYQGDPTDAMYLLIDGNVRVFRSNQEGEEQELAQLGQGGHFGELSLIDGEPRNASVAATTDAEFFMLGRAEFISLLSQSESMLSQTLRGLSIILRKTNESKKDVQGDNEIAQSNRDKNARGNFANNEIGALAKVQFFQDLSEAELREVAHRGTTDNWREHESVFSEGDPGNSLYVVLSGTVLLHLGKTMDGQELARLESGGFFGEMALLDAKPRSASATMLTEGRLFRLGRSAFLELLESSPKVLAEVLLGLSRNIRRTNEMQ